MPKPLTEARAAKMTTEQIMAEQEAEFEAQWPQASPVTPPAMPATLSAPTPLTLPPIPPAEWVEPAWVAPGNTIRKHDPNPDPACLISKADLPPAAMLDLPPAEFALRFLREGAHPDDVRLIHQELADIASKVADLIEGARIGEGIHSADQLASLIGREFKRRDELYRCLQRLGEEVPERLDPAVEVLNLVKSVARFRDLRGLLDARPGLLEDLRRKLSRVRNADWDGLRAILVSRRSVRHESESLPFLAKMAACLTEDQDLRRRITALDPRGDAGRAELVRKAIEKAGRDDLVAALAPHQPSQAAAGIPAAQRAVEALDARIAATDPESQRYASLQIDRRAAQDALEGLCQQAAAEQAAAALAIVQGPHSGRFRDIAALADEGVWQRFATNWAIRPNVCLHIAL